MLRGTSCVVRPLRLSDADAIVRHANNLNVAKHLRDRFPHPYTREDAIEFLIAVAGPDGDSSTLAIEVDGEAAGAIGFIVGNDVERYSAEIGYWLGESCWGRGIMTEALRLVSDHLFADRNLLRLFALPFSDNPASARVLEKAGYVREAVLRSSCVKYGVPRDQLLYVRINDAWKGQVQPVP
jgi:RimJ/RimL family protein N-acetyltransferase